MISIRYLTKLYISQERSAAVLGAPVSSNMHTHKE
jgi:hypothetical protein